MDFLQDRFPNRSIHQFVLTYPDIDHMSGLYRLNQEGIEIVNLWDTRHDKSLSESAFQGSPYDARDWAEYQRLRFANGVATLRLNRGDKGVYSEGDGIFIASPAKELEDAAARGDWNHLSYVLFVKHFDQWLILGGDARCVWRMDGGRRLALPVFRLATELAKPAHDSGRA